MPKPDIAMAEVMRDLANLGCEFSVGKDTGGDKLALSAGEARAGGVTLNQAGMQYLGELPNDRFFTGILQGQLVVREL